MSEYINIEEIRKTYAEKRGISAESLTPKKATIAVSLNDNLLTVHRIDEDIIIQSLGLSKGEYYEHLTPEDIKYHPILFQRVRSTDLVVFNRYIFSGSIKASTHLRIWKGDSYWEHRIEDVKTLSTIASAIITALYWQKKAKNLVKRKRDFYKLAESYRQLPGALLADLLELSIFKKSEKAPDSPVNDDEVV